ncbi:unnamed protein product [Haemonchus placei]|uniref:Uncharacterized protein n=1 Tax=Haemonchus placei TaxID=6290 RepID=A0A0N4VWH5_HAEPC|nr:unnamed protein product [Haemonchus placei]
MASEERTSSNETADDRQHHSSKRFTLRNAQQSRRRLLRPASPPEDGRFEIYRSAGNASEASPWYRRLLGLRLLVSC